MTFLWHDYETFGTNPAYDRPVQFAAIRTDERLDPIGEPMNWFAKPARDALPHPYACLVTGITPQRAEREGQPEAEFADAIHEQMMVPGTCGVGYNSLRFDDAVTRHLFYRNFIDPYEREYRNGNSRWDLIDLVRMCYALRPDGMTWPERVEQPGVPSFRLEELTAANDIAHAGAHDALVDVEATIEFARRLRSAQPRLFDWGLQMRDRRQVGKLLDVSQPRPLLLTSSLIPATRGCTTLVLPLAAVPDRPKEIVVFDLMSDPTPLLDLDADAIAERVFTRRDDLPEGTERIPLMTVGTNKVPMLAPAGTLRGADPERIGLDSSFCERNAETLTASLAAIKRKVMDVYLRPARDPDPDPDGMLYSGGFFSDRDRAGFRSLKRLTPAELAKFDWAFDDSRVEEMLFRYRARNWPESLDGTERKRWEQDRLGRLHSGTIADRLDVERFEDELESARAERAGNEKDLALLRDVASWVENVMVDDTSD